MTRFEKIVKDPRFRSTRVKQTKVVVDERFKGVFKDPKFTQPYRMDKYGRPVETKDAAEREMKRFYRLDSDAESAEEGVDTDASIEDDFTSEESENESSVDEESEVDDTMDQAFSQHPLVNTQIELGDATRRLALVNVDWDQLKAVDLFVMLAAFKPAMGQIKSVKIFPSEFGKERLAREAREGPPKDIFNKPNDESEVESSSSSDSEIDPLEDLRKAGVLTEEAGTFNVSALRRYQLERLRYYYAVIECDSVETAIAIYNHCDGREFETSTNTLDLRYIPDDVMFEEAEMTDCAMKAPKKYDPKHEMVTDALQRSAVKLTWDQDDPDRKRLTRANLSREAMEEADLRAYLASDSEENEQDEGEGDNKGLTKTFSKEDKIAKYRALLLESKKENVFGRKSQDKNEELNITFTSGIMKQESESESEDDLKQDFNEERVAVFDEEGNLVSSVDDATSKKSKKPAKPGKEQFVLEKDWSKQKKGKKMVRKRERDEEESKEFSINLQDERFKAVFDEPAYAIDPTASNFKRTKSMEAIISERQRRKHK